MHEANDTRPPHPPSCRRPPRPPRPAHVLRTSLQACASDSRAQVRSSSRGGGGLQERGALPMTIVILCLFVMMGLVQVIRPQLLWKMNRPLQAPFVKNYDATE
ncbi:DUF6199 family natural product biosynthesis protein, partial [Streptomyces sp. NPDC102473]|uniref:DUF6199 family natural product biosynthesis protein n=1 Tax=Streptomyces sp. NPDC102473 TaxID=3366180 RepID=UPI00381D93E3